MKPCSGATSDLNEFLVEIFENCRWPQDAVTSTPRASGLSSQASIVGASAASWAPLMLWIHLEPRTPLHRTAHLKISPIGSYEILLQKTRYFTKKQDVHSTSSRARNVS